MPGLRIQSHVFTTTATTRDRLRCLTYAAHYTKGAGLIYCSGQIGQDENGKLIGDVSAQTVRVRKASNGTAALIPRSSEQEQILKNLTKVLEHAGSDWDHVLKVNIFLKKMEDFDAINAVYTKALPEDKPARTCVQAGCVRPASKLLTAEHV